MHPRSPRVPDIRKGDQVLVLSGKEAGKRGTVEHVVRNRQGFKKTVSKYGSAWRADDARWPAWPSWSKA